MESETSTPSVEHPAFTAPRGDLAKLLLLNTVLTILTIGIYRFWARTKIRRFFWRHVRFLGDPLEYIGTPGELFLGFLIVLAILFPIGAVYGAINALTPPDAGMLHISIEIIYYVVLFLLLQIAFYRMWRYRMRRTLWRGVRFWLDGSSWQYLKLATGWWIVTVMTLGIAYPWMSADLWRYQIQHTRFGADAFDFDGNARELLPAWLSAWIPALLLFGGIAVVGYAAEAPQFGQPGRRPTGLLFGAGTAITIGAITLPLTYFWYRVRQSKFLLSGVRFGGAHFISSLRFWPILKSWLISIALVIAVMIPLGLWLEISTTGVNLGAGNPDTILAKGILPIAGIFIFFVVGIPLIFGAVLGYDVAKQIVTTLRVENAQAFETVAQAVGPNIKYGEGLADALDIGGL